MDAWMGALRPYTPPPDLGAKTLAAQDKISRRDYSGLLHKGAVQKAHKALQVKAKVDFILGLEGVSVKVREVGRLEDRVLCVCVCVCVCVYLYLCERAVSTRVCVCDMQQVCTLCC